jgi:uncharacterized protein (DUF433 family)
MGPGAGPLRDSSQAQNDKLGCAELPQCICQDRDLTVRCELNEAITPVVLFFVCGSGAMKFNRITVDPEICLGKPCVRGLRFPVSRLFGLLAAGETRENILKADPYLEPADLDEALLHAVWLAEDETIEIAGSQHP